MVLDRTLAPEIYPIQNITFEATKPIYLSQSLEIFTLNKGTQPVVRCDLVFEAGNKFESKNGLSYFTVKNLAEGTHKYSSVEIANKMAHIGYFVEYSQGAERANIRLNGLAKFLPKALEIIVHILQEANFPSAEVEKQKNIYLQGLLVSQQKTAHLASVAFKAELFGQQHYLGRHLDKNATENISNNDLIEFYKDNIQSKGFKVFIAGQISDNLIDEVENILKPLANGTLKAGIATIQQNTSKGKKIHIDKQDSLQASIRLGQRIFGRKHEDYHAFVVFNTLLGGFFGSRLMKNIREDKGYTYGINASMVPHQAHGYWLIGTDVKKENTKQTLEEIAKEIELLKTISVESEELTVAKNFLIGDYASSFNSVFELGEKQKMLVYEQLPPSYFNEYIDKIRAVSSEQVKLIAQKYMNLDAMIEVVVG